MSRIKKRPYLRWKQYFEELRGMEETKVHEEPKQKNER